MKQNTGKVRLSLVGAAAAALGLSAVVIAQQQATQVTEATKSGQVSGTATGSASASGFARAGASAGGSQFARGGQSAGGFGLGHDPNKKLFAVWYDKNPQANNGNDPSADVGHATYMKQLMQDGTLVLEGPFGDNSGYLLILQANTAQDALRLVQNEPAVRSGELRFTLRPWTWRYGGARDGLGRPVPAAGGKAGGNVFGAGGG